MGHTIKRTEQARAERREWAQEIVGSKAYLWVKKDNAVGNQVCFPVDIKEARISFGKIHFRVVPHSVATEGLGTRWVEESQLFFPFDMSFKRLEGTFYKDLAQCPVPGRRASDAKNDKFWQRHYDDLFAQCPTAAREFRGFFRLGKKLSKDVMYVPIQVQDARVSFGTAQYQIIPYGTSHLRFWMRDKDENVGNIWVEIGTLILEHDREFEILRDHYSPFSEGRLLYFSESDEDDTVNQERL